jgi:signal transduction histidine kinase
MFFRATERSHGSGLGLYIVKGTIENLGGKISVESVVNEGSTFNIELPTSRMDGVQFTSPARNLERLIQNAM